MKIVLVGGGTGGHFYPLIATARALRDIAEEMRIVNLELVMMGDTQFDSEAILAEDIKFEYIPAGKLRRYFSLKNFSDSIKTLRGIARAFLKFTVHPPDVVFSKGGYDSFPVLVVSRLYRIPVIIHESDAIPGIVNRWAGTFARRIGISFPETMSYFPKDKVALVGHPIRQSVLGGSKDEALDMFELEEYLPTLLVLGGSQGAQKINDIVITMLKDLVEKIQIIHSAGPLNAGSIQKEADVALGDSPHKKRYHVYPTLAPAQLRNASFIANLVISRAGAGSLFEIAAWRLPAILIPITDSAQNHQRENAYNYARLGAATVVEEENVTPHVLFSEIMKIVEDKTLRETMKQAASTFARVDAASKLANEIFRLGLHE